MLRLIAWLWLALHGVVVPEVRSNSDESGFKDSSTPPSGKRNLQVSQLEQGYGGQCVVVEPFNEEVHKPVYTVGVLAIRGFDAAYAEFNATFADYLTATAGQRFDPPIEFTLTPLNFLSLFTDTAANLVDFIYVNPSAYSCIESEYGAFSLASQVSRRNVGGQIYELTKFGGVIATLATNDQVNSIADLEGKIVAAASISGLGSGQMQFREMQLAGMSYINDPQQLVFTSNQGKVVKGVLNGDFDVGFIRTDQLERSKDADGNPVNLSNFKIIRALPDLEIDGEPFPFDSSTPLYPEWNIAALTHIDGAISAAVQNAMLAIEDHATVGRALAACVAEHNATYCDGLAFPQDFVESARCDTSKEVAELAVTAMTNGKYAGWRTTLSYMELRAMQETTGFIRYDSETNIWSCIRSKLIYDSITCPENFLKKGEDEVAKSCPELGLTCQEGFQCICSPCYEPLVCENNSVIISNTCVRLLVLLPSTLIPIAFLAAIFVFCYVEYKKKQADALWSVDPMELIFGDPPTIIGRGTFGLVLMAEYRGTTVAVKRVIPPKSTNSKSWLGRGQRDSMDDSQSTFFNDSIGEGKEETNEVDVLFQLAEKGKRRGSISRKNAMADAKLGGASLNQHAATQLLQTLETLVQADEEAGLGSTDGFNSHTGYKSTIAPATGKGGGKVQAKRSFGRWTHLKADFVREMRHLAKLRHPCITTVMGAVISNWEEPMLVMEFMSHGSLYDILHNETIPLDGTLVLPILRDVAQGLRFLHSAEPQVIHGDLKAANVLVDAKFRAKVADFGLSQKKQVGMVGTPFWMAPELLAQKSENTAASDMYSFGIILFEVYSRKDPYEGEDPERVLLKVCDPLINYRPPVPESCPPKVEQIMAKCLLPNPEERVTSEELDLHLKALVSDNVEPKMTEEARRHHHDSSRVLYDVFPKHIADDLRAGKKIEPESHECVSIFFSDIVGFTTIASELAPIQVSNLLDRLYSSFDELASKHEVFKIETVGDAYMGVTNLVRDQEADHAKRIASFAVEAIEAANSILIDPDDPERGHVNLRVGFHSGPVVSNVVGSLNPKYGIFGDTVNTAARMESNSKENRIQCSQRSAELLKKQDPLFPIRLRGSISIKGKGEMVTFWVNETS